MDLLERLQSWYLRQCDGDWEHAYGVSLQSLDNPGWLLRVDLVGTPLHLRPFVRVEFERSETDWIQCFIENHAFVGAGGPENLRDLLSTFLDWADDQG